MSETLKMVIYDNFIGIVLRRNRIWLVVINMKFCIRHTTIPALTGEVFTIEIYCLLIQFKFGEYANEE